MTEIRVFFSGNLEAIEKQINNFLKSQPKIKVINVNINPFVRWNNENYIGIVTFSH